MSAEDRVILMRSASYALLIAATMATPLQASDRDLHIAMVRQVFDLKPRGCVDPGTPPSLDSSARLGKALFESKALSGNRDTACSTCHLESHGLSDGLPIAIGVGGSGEGEQRLHDGEGILVPRNAFSLFGRGRSDFVSFFWDGRVQQENERIVSPIGDELPGFKSALSVAAVLPLLERDEFIGVRSYAMPNEIERRAQNQYYKDRLKAVERALRDRFVAKAIGDDESISAALEDAGVAPVDLKMHHIGNALADFITQNFPCRATSWDAFLGGDTAALSDDEQEGMLLYFGRGRCASCHAGPVASDFRAHSIGVPQGPFGPHSRHRDLGRAAVTTQAKDLLLFRTPPLLSARDTAPYGHNGIFPSLGSVIRHHINPVALLLSMPDLYLREHFHIGRTMSSRSKLLDSIDLRSEEEIESLVAFIRLL